MHKLAVAIIDYGMGNLYSISNACDYVGLTPIVTSDKSTIMNSKAMILPGVGAFGDAMNNLREKDLIITIKEFVDTGKPVLGICLGMQLLMDKSFELGQHEGLGIIRGKVIKFENSITENLKVPQVGWNKLSQIKKNAWKDSLLHGLPNDFHMYFVHSLYVKPNDMDVELATTQYGHIKFCSALKHRNIFACQAHPERSGLSGLEIYRNLSKIIHNKL